jgi:hypothetical protein
MNEEQTAAPKFVVIVAIISLVWNLMGCGIFLTEVFAQESMMESMTEKQKDWVRSTPSWVYILFAISVSTGLAGSIFLWVRNRYCVVLYSISLGAVLHQMIYTMVIAGGLQVMGPSGAVMPTIVILLAVTWLIYAVSLLKKKALH